MIDLINKRNEYLNSLSIKKNDRYKYIISNTESLNKKEITKLIKEKYIRKKIIEKKKEDLKKINNEILYKYIEYLDKLGHKVIYLNKYNNNNNNLFNIKKYFEENIFISIVDFKSDILNLNNLYNNNNTFSIYMRTDPLRLIISPDDAKSEGYKIFLRNLRNI